MDQRTPGPPRPKPRTRSTATLSTLSHTTPPSQAPPPLSSRPGVLVEATQPLSSRNDREYLKWLLESTYGGRAHVKEVVVSQDRTRAFVELADSGVIPQLLSNCANLKDSLSGAPLYLSRVDLLTLGIIVKGFPPFIDDSALITHFENEANGKQVHSVQISESKDSALITFVCPTVSLDIVSKSTSICGANLSLELTFNNVTRSAKPQPVPMVPSVLCVHGFPESTLNNPEMLSKGLKWYFKGCTGLDATSCTIENGIGFLTFADTSAVQTIIANPPTEQFMAGTILHMSATSQPPNLPKQLSPSAPREAWNAPTAPNEQMPQGNAQMPPTGGQMPPRSGYLPGNMSPQRQRPVTAPVSKLPVAPPRRCIINNDVTDSIAVAQYSPPNTGGLEYPNSGYSPRLSPDQHQPGQYHQQQNISFVQANNGIHHSPSAPVGLGQYGGQYGQLQSDYHRHPPQQGGQNNTTMHTVSSWQGFQAGGQTPLPQGQQAPREDAHYPSSHSGNRAESDLCQKILVKDLSGEAKHPAVLRYYFKQFTGGKVNVDVNESCAIVTFQNPIHIKSLYQSLRQNPLEGVVPSVSPLKESDTVLVSGFEESTQDVLIKLIMASYVKDAGVKSYRRLSLTSALVTFSSTSSAQRALVEPVIETEGMRLTVKEYFDFMSTNKPESAANASPADQSKQPPETVQQAQEESLSREQHAFLKNTLCDLNENLQSLKARADIKRSKNGKDFSLVISPLYGSGGIKDWETQIAAAREEHFAQLAVETITLPNKNAKAAVNELLLDQYRDDVYVTERKNDCIVISGQRDIITEACQQAQEICLEHEITTKTVELPQKHIKFLRQFHHQDFNKLKQSGVYIQFHPDNGSIDVTANPVGHTEVETVIKMREKAEEKALVISNTAHKLLSSVRGTKKLSEIFGVASSQFVYDLEQKQDGPDGTLKYQVCFLSLDQVSLKDCKKKVKLYVHEISIPISAAKIRVTSSQEWRDFVSKLCEEHFVAITAIEASKTITVTGEQIVCKDIAQQVCSFLERHTNVEDRFTVSRGEWFVINSHFSKEMKGINDQAKQKQVKLEWPKPNNKASSLPIVISGEPDVVDSIKVQVKMLLKNICRRESKVAGIPAVAHVLQSMEDKIRLIETDEKVSIEVTLENGDDNSELTTAAQAVGEVPRLVCSATSSKGSRVSIFTGDSTQNAPVGVIVNFVPPNPNIHVGQLKHLLEAGGPEAIEDFKHKVDQFMQLDPGTVFKTRCGQLRCSQLLHCVLPSWKNSDKATADKEYFLDEVLYEVFRDALHSGSFLVTPLTAAPLHYPLNVFVKYVTDAVDQSDSDLQLSVYVEELHHAQEFQSAFKTRNFQIHHKVPLASPLLPDKKPDQSSTPITASAKTISSNLSSFISLVNGDLLKQQADVYINSTNTNLNLKQGQLSKLLLNACGDELQKECSEYAPLKPTQVAVTDAKNLNCNHIFHIALPEYKIANSERQFRETIKQILRIAKTMSISSIAIPSLGVANLGYPADVSAKILFQEVIAFHMQFPTTVQKFIFVIFEKNVFQAFSKEYAEQMSGGSHAKAPPDPPPTVSTAAATPTGSTTLTIAQGNIADEKTDIIVNTTTEDMALKKSAVGKAILEKAGEQLQKTCTQYIENGMRLEDGQIFTTPAFGKLRCKKLIHAHLPHKGAMVKSSTHHGQLIEKIVMECLNKAESLNMQSISFPAFGLGGGGYSVEQVAEPMLKAFQKFGQTSPKSVTVIRVVIYDTESYTKFNDFYSRFFGCSSANPSPSPGFWSRLIGNSNKVEGVKQELQGGGGSHIQTPPIWALSRSVRNATIVFQIFAASEKQCEKIVEQLRQLISEKSETKKIKNNHIGQLMDADMAEIIQIGDNFGVQVKVMAKIKEIQISGERSKVLEAQGEIAKVFTDIDRSILELRDFEWLSEEDDGGFEAYPGEAGIRLERAYRKGLKAIELIVDGVAVVIDLQSNTETDKATGKMRKIVRAKKSMGQVEFPSTWQSIHQPGGKREPTSMFEVDPGSQEYTDAVTEFEESMKRRNINFTIEKVQRIENKTQYHMHMALNASVKVKHKKEPLVKRLFHGSKFDSLQLIAVQGFNRNFAADANAAYFGRGVYFAVEAWYSAQDKYAVPDSNGLQYMFVCRVVIGEFAPGKGDMKTAPPLTAGSKEVYDTLVDNVSSPTIYVAMTDAQAYPEYLITFKKVK